jgi:hypothetical protein
MRAVVKPICVISGVSSSSLTLEFDDADDKLNVNLLGVELYNCKVEVIVYI